MIVSPLHRSAPPQRLTAPAERPPAEDQFESAPRSKWTQAARGLALAAAALTCCTQDHAVPHPDPNAYVLPGAGQWHPTVHENKRTFKIAGQQQDAVRHARPLFSNSLGQRFPMHVQRVNAREIDFSLGQGQRIAVTFDNTFTPAQQIDAAAHIIDLQSQAPPLSQGLVSRFEVHKAGSLGLVQAQTQGSVMRFIGTQNINTGVFFHEFGHLIGRQARLQMPHGAGPGPVNSAPDGWLRAIRADHSNVVSDYARTTVHKESPRQGYGEDFAEFFSAYCEARSQGKKAMDQLQVKFPARVQLMNQVWRQFTPPPSPSRATG